MEKPPVSNDVRKPNQSEYFLVVSPKKIGKPRKYRVHWFNDDLKCIGCRFSPEEGDVHPFMTTDWNPEEYGFCQKAARICSPPGDFSSEPPPAEDEGSDVGDLADASISSLHEEDDDEP